MKTFLVIYFLTLVLSINAKGTLDVYWVDVEGGAATLIVTPAGESLLVDTGNPGTRDAGRIHHVATKIAGLKKIDHLITTHFHGDHYGGAAMLANLMPIGVVNDNGIPKKNPDRHRKNPIFPPARQTLPRHEGGQSKRRQTGLCLPAEASKRFGQVEGDLRGSQPKGHSAPSKRSFSQKLLNRQCACKTGGPFRQRQQRGHPLRIRSDLGFIDWRRPHLEHRSQTSNSHSM